MDKRKKILTAVAPALVAVVVVIAFAISGNITKKADIKNPTATTQAVPVNVENPTTQKPQNTKVTLVAVGDNLIHNTLITAGEQDDGSLNYTSLYANIKPDIESADIAVIDQETVLGGDEFEYTGYPVFNSPWEIGEAAIDAGFDIFNCATNHTLDKGWAGVENELEFFKEHKDVVALGINDSEESSDNIAYYEKNGITFALFNFTYGTNGIPLPSDKPWCIDLLENKDKIKQQLAQARKNADCVIVFPHWGTEYSFDASEYQKEYTQLFYDAGVDIVIGCHTHVIEPVEWITKEGSDRKMLVYYSLGNFISHQTDLYSLLGGMAQVTIEKIDGKIQISSAKLVPIVCHYKRGTNDKFEFNVYKLSDYNNDLAASHSQKGGTVEYYTGLVKDVVKNTEFLDF